MPVELTDNEIALARELLESEYADMKSQIYRAGVPEFRDELKARMATLESVLRKLGSTAISEVSTEA